MNKIIFIIIITFVSSGNAKEIIMKCNAKNYINGISGEEYKMSFKWKDSFIGKPKVFFKRDGEWVTICDSKKNKNQKEGYLKYKRFFTPSYPAKRTLKCKVQTAGEKKDSYYEEKNDYYVDFQMLDAKFNRIETTTSKSPYKENTNEFIDIIDKCEIVKN